MKIKDKDVMTTVKLNSEEILDIIQALRYALDKDAYHYNEDGDRARELKKQFGKMYNNALKFKKEKSKASRNPMYDIMEDKEDEWYENYKKKEFKDGK